MTSQDIIDEWDLRVYEQTLLNSFRRFGIGHFWAAQTKFLSKANKDTRLARALQHKEQSKAKKYAHIEDYYKKILYSNACHFAVNQAKTKKVWRLRGKDKDGALWRYKNGKFQRRKEVQKVLTSVAAMVGWKFKSKLVVISRHIDGDKYIKEFLDLVVRPFFKLQRKEGVTD
jgi:hypothetical protein